MKKLNVVISDIVNRLKSHASLKNLKKILNFYIENEYK